jgi:hypothetical protein
MFRVCSTGTRRPRPAQRVPEIDTIDQPGLSRIGKQQEAVGRVRQVRPTMSHVEQQLAMPGIESLVCQLHAFERTPANCLGTHTVTSRTRKSFQDFVAEFFIRVGTRLRQLRRVGRMVGNSQGIHINV